MRDYELSIPHSELKMLAVATDVYSPASFAAAKIRAGGCSILSRKLRSPPFAPPYRFFSRKLVVDSVFGEAEACVREAFLLETLFSPNLPQINWSGR